MNRPRYARAARLLMVRDYELAQKYVSFDWYSREINSEDNVLLRALDLPATGKSWKGLRRALMRLGFERVYYNRMMGDTYRFQINEFIAAIGADSNEVYIDEQDQPDAAL